ncbi:MAG: porin [Proteobacteria bacterium]|nr:porin [Pseudomonadota bacterium]
MRGNLAKWVFVVLFSLMLIPGYQSAWAAEMEKNVAERIIDILKDKGVLKEEEYQELKKMVENEKEQDKKVPRVSFKKGFSLETPDQDFKLKITGRFQSDFKLFEKDHPSTNSFYVRRARLAMGGTMYKYYDFFVESEFGQGSARLNDGYLNINYTPKAQLRVGQFKEPFSLEELISDNWTDMIERSLANNIPPSRDIGAMIHGDLYSGALNYAVAVYNGRSINQQTDTDDDKDVAGRIIFAPFQLLGMKENKFLKNLRLGAAFTYGYQDSNVTDWWKQGKFKTEAMTTFFALRDTTTAGKENYVSQSGKRIRLGAELGYQYDSFSLKGELMKMDLDDLILNTYNSTLKKAVKSDERDFDVKGGYISVSYFLTGEKEPFKSGVYDAITPKKKFDPFQGTWGAWQIAFRYSFLSLDRDLFKYGYADPKKYTDKADAYTAGVNWYLNDMVRVMVNYIHTSFDDDVEVSGKKIDNEDVWITRFQIVW